MRSGPFVGVAGFATAAAALALPLPEPARAAMVLPALFWLPGRPWLRERGEAVARRELRAVAVAMVTAVVGVLLARLGGWGAPALLGWQALVWLAGEAVARPSLAPARPLQGGPALGLVAVALATAGVAWSWWGAVERPLDRYWYHPAVDAGWPAARPPPAPGEGWATVEAVGEHGAVRLVPTSTTPTLVGPFAGDVLLLLHGPVGVGMTVGDDGVSVRREVTEVADEGPVPRYLDAGVAALRVSGPVGAGETRTVLLTDPERSEVWLVPSAEAVWDLHGRGRLRHVHYYQLLNLVEQQRWADELARTRWVTDVQPPLWSWLLAAPLEMTGGALPTTNVVLLGLLLALGLAGLAALEAWVPHASPVAFLLPAAVLPVHARLLYEPGSAGMPDTLYTLGVVAAFAALPGDRGVGRWALVAQLARYPATLLTVSMALLAGRRGAAIRVLGLVGAAMAAFGAGGAATGALPRWMATVWWEIGPEHWHGEHDPLLLAARAPRFYALWLAYAGATPLLAMVRWPRGTRAALGGALIYSLLLCTIDHSPSHYFLPLVHLAALSVATTAEALPGAGWRTAWPALAVAGLLTTLAWVDVVG